MIASLPLPAGAQSVKDLSRHYQNRFLRCAMRQLDAVFDAFEAGIDDPTQATTLRASDVQLFNRVQKLLAERDESELIELPPPADPAILKPAPRAAPTAKQVANSAPDKSSEVKSYVKQAEALLKSYESRRQAKVQADVSLVSVPASAVPTTPGASVRPAMSRAERRQAERQAKKAMRKQRS